MSFISELVLPDGYPFSPALLKLRDAINADVTRLQNRRTKAEAEQRRLASLGSAVLLPDNTTALNASKAELHDVAAAEIALGRRYVGEFLPALHGEYHRISNAASAAIDTKFAELHAKVKPALLKL